MRSSHANGPSSASTIIPSTITGGDSFAPGIAPSNPSSARGSLEPSPTVVQCSECGKTLTGSYASGNLTRHQKSKQCAASKNRKVFVCGIDGCPNQYERSDALLNHKRKKHDHPGPSKKL